MDTKSKLIWFGIGILVVNLGLFLGSKFLLNKVADKVIEKLQKEYSPSPYGPGFDPDKVSPDAFKGLKKHFEMQQRSSPNINSELSSPMKVALKMATTYEWRNEWESERDFNH